MILLSLLYGTIIFNSLTFAQTWTECNPMNTTCPNNPALGTSHNFVLNSTTNVNNYFNVSAGFLKYGTGNAEFVVKKKGDSPTIQSEFFIMFGSVSVIMKAASGQGIISSIVLESDDLDEVDWEFLGGNGTHVESNYFGKGNITSFDRAIYHPVSFDPRAEFHNYTVHWTSAELQWWIDSKLVRSLPYAHANGGHNFPQTPMNVRLGIWAAGDKGNSPGTIDWAGGVTDYSKGPFSMEVQSTEITDFGSGKEYQWTDKSGSWQSIVAIPGNSTALKKIMKSQEPPEPTLLERFGALSSAKKLIVYCCVGATGALLFFALIFACHRARRKGRQERDAYAARLEKEREDTYQDQVELNSKTVGGWDSRSYKQNYGAPAQWNEHGAPVNNAMSGHDKANHSTASLSTGDTSESAMIPNKQYKSSDSYEVMRSKSFSSRNPIQYS